MHRMIKKAAALGMAVVLGITSVGCSSGKNQKKDREGKATSEATQKPRVEAEGKGKNKSDVPLIMGCRGMDGDFNPFSTTNAADNLVTSLTQLRLLTFDREGALVRRAIKGEKRRFRGENYYYQGPANCRIQYYKKDDQTVYRIRLRKDLFFSDKEPVTIDDVIFSIYAFADKSYQGDEKVGELPILGLKEYRSNEERSKIEGIKRLNEWEMTVTVKGCRREDARALNIPICPSHYYAVDQDFNVLANNFGFPRGDISGLCQKKKLPYGAGPYQYIKYEKGIAYFEANDEYYKGSPKTVFLLLKEMKDASVQQTLQDLANGEVDVLTLTGSDEAVEMIRNTNGNGSLNGKCFTTQQYDGERYAYIGMDAEQVCVDQKPDSTRSKLLRKGLAVLLGFGKNKIPELYEKSGIPINYPSSATNWSVPQAEDEEYEQAYSRNAEGKLIYNSNMDDRERENSAQRAALGYIKKAGGRIRDDRVVEMPEHTAKSFTILVPGSADAEAMRALAEKSERLFKEIGLELKIKEAPYPYEKQQAAKLWYGYQLTTPDVHLYELYHSTDKHSEQRQANLFHIEDSDLDEYLEDLQTTTGLKKSSRLYERSYRKILDWGIFVPLYQSCDLVVFHSGKVNPGTIEENTTPYYSWLSEIEALEMK